MLVFTRREKESFFIGSDIKIKVINARSGQARIGIEAPKDTAILREELAQRHGLVDDYGNWIENSEGKTEDFQSAGVFAND